MAMFQVTLDMVEELSNKIWIFMVLAGVLSSAGQYSSKLVSLPGFHVH